MTTTPQKKRKGNQVIPVRLPPDTLAAIDSICKRSEATRREEPYDRSSWIRAAIKEKLDKDKRSKKASAKAAAKKRARKEISKKMSELS